MRAILEGLVEGLVTFDLDGTILYVNVSACRLYGLGSIPGRNVRSAKVGDLATYCYPDGRAVEEGDTPAARVLRGETFSEYELWTYTSAGPAGRSNGHTDRQLNGHAARHTDGHPNTHSERRSNRDEPRWLGAYSGTLVEDSMTLGVLSMRDVTAQRELEARFRATFEVNPTAISIIRLADLRFSDVNNSFLNLSGYSRDDVIGKTAAELGLFLEYGKRDAALRQLRRGHTESIVEYEASLRQKTGKVRQVLSEGRVIMYDSDPHLIDTYLDITERKRSENELMQAIQATMADPSWFARVVLEKLAEIRAGGETKVGLEQLTKREQGVLELLARGHGNAQIAQELGLSRHTVRNYVATLYSKLGVKSRAEAVIWARERGLIFPA